MRASALVVYFAVSAGAKGSGTARSHNAGDRDLEAGARSVTASATWRQEAG
jgi:hypothetical protein